MLTDVELTKAYEAWDPSQCSASELASNCGMSKGTLYNRLRRLGVPLKKDTSQDGPTLAERVEILEARVASLETRRKR